MGILCKKLHGFLKISETTKAFSLKIIYMYSMHFLNMPCIRSISKILINVYHCLLWISTQPAVQFSQSDRINLNLTGQVVKRWYDICKPL